MEKYLGGYTPNHCERKLFMTLVKECEVDFIQGDCHGGVLMQGREIGLTSEYNREKWGFVSKEQSWAHGGCGGAGGSGWEITKRIG